MKTLLLVVSALVLSLGPAKPHSYHKVQCDRSFSKFSFAGKYGGCDNAMDGRWYIHFLDGGEMTFGFWGGPEDKPAYRYDDERTKTVPLGDVFRKGTKWKRINTHTISFINGDRSQLFTMLPNYEAEDPNNAIRKVTFVEVGGKGRIFALGFHKHYKSKFEASEHFE